MTITSGDLLKAEADAIVNTVNCVGVMGKGIALQFKKKWPENFKAYEKAFEPLKQSVEGLAYAPAGAPRATEMEIRTKKPDLTPGRAVLIKLIALYRELDYSLSKIEVQKLCYFAQCAGQPLKLDFVKNQYGPYAPKLRHVLTHIGGHYVLGVGDHDRAETELTLLPGALEEADEFLREHADSHQRMERVGRLIEGFETPLGMELLATVHWVATRQCQGEGVDCVMSGIEAWDSENPAWNERKKALMTRSQVGVALNRLAEGGWLESQAVA